MNIERVQVSTKGKGFTEKKLENDLAPVKCGNPFRKLHPNRQLT